MQVLVLAGGILFAAAVGYVAVDRIDCFWDAGGISSCWDVEEKAAAKCRKEASLPGTVSQQDSCGISNFEI